MSDLTFGDADPEDAYDATDPADVRLDILERIVDDLRDDETERFDGRRGDLLRLLDNMDREGLDLNRREARRLRKLMEAADEL